MGLYERELLIPRLLALCTMADRLLQCPLPSLPPDPLSLSVDETCDLLLTNRIWPEKWDEPNYM